MSGGHAAVNVGTASQPLAISCSWCGDPIPPGAGHYRLYPRQYHIVCWETLPSTMRLEGTDREAGG
jgi:hypothetical protein